MRRRLLIAAGVVLFLGTSLVLARFLTGEGGQRAEVLDLLRAQARGDEAAVLAQLDDCAAPCREAVRDSVRRTRGPGEVDLVRLDSDVSYSLGATEGWARVVWVRGADGAPVVQCVRVRREGNPLTGRDTALLRITRPLADNEASC